MVYPDSKAQEVLNDQLVPAKVNFGENPDLRRRYGVAWTPTYVFVDGEGTAQQRISPASLPVEEFVPVVLAGAGRALFNAGRYDDAIRRFDKILENHPKSLAAPEALYWRGVACYRKDDKDLLMRSWNDLASKYPQSYWAKSIAFLRARK